MSDTQNSVNLEYRYLTKSLKANVEEMKQLFQDDDTLVFRPVGNRHEADLSFVLMFCDGMVNNLLINDHIIRPLEQIEGLQSGKGRLDSILQKVVTINEVKKSGSLRDIVESVTYGDTILLVEGESEALILNTKGFLTRSIQEPDGEKTLSGPKEGFTEQLLMNLSMIRRKVRNNDLKMKFQKVGKRTATQVCICYIEGIVNRSVLEELEKRLARIDIDAVLDSNYLNELISDNRWSPFPSVGRTEKPDIVAANLLEGRVALLVDGTPVVLSVPYLFIENFQSSEDYALNFYYTGITRTLRILAFIGTLLIPNLYIAAVAYHHEMMPTVLLLNIAKARNNVPLPAVLEFIVMILAFDLIRETGVRMPSSIGQSLSIVGALVIGDAAVQANLVAAPMVIIVAITAITALIVPRLRASVVLLRLVLLIFTLFMGIFGVALGAALIALHIFGLQSFGIAQLELSGEMKVQSMKDTFFRAPLWMMKERPARLTQNRTRLKEDGRP